MFDRYNIVSEDDLRIAAQKTTMYLDTLADEAHSWVTSELRRPLAKGARITGEPLDVFPKEF